MTVGRFLAGIGALIWHEASQKYLLMRRASHRDAGAGSWECVTGRVDQGEGFEESLLREIREEIGVDATIEFLIGTSHFYRGEAIPENELLGVLYLCSITDPDAITVSDEHDEIRWLTADEVYEFLDQKNWLYRTIQRAELMRQHLSPELSAHFRERGFEMS